jgi:hypothetical protein
MLCSVVDRFRCREIYSGQSVQFFGVNGPIFVVFSQNQKKARQLIALELVPQNAARCQSD